MQIDVPDCIIGSLIFSKAFLRATYGNRKWTFLIFGQWMRSNFQVNRVYTSNDTWYYKCGSAKASKKRKRLVLALRVHRIHKWRTARVSLGNEAGEDRIPNSNTAISESETPTAPVLLKQSDIPEASLAGRKPAGLGKANLCFGGHLSVIVKAQLVRRR